MEPNSIPSVDEVREALVTLGWHKVGRHYEPPESRWQGDAGWDCAVTTDQFYFHNDTPCVVPVVRWNGAFYALEPRRVLDLDRLPSLLGFVAADIAKIRQGGRK